MYQSDIRAIFKIMREKPQDWDNDTLYIAKGYDLWLSKATTCFLIMVYQSIFNETDALFRVLQNKIMDIGFCCERIRNTMQAVEGQRQGFDNFYSQFEQKCVTLGLTDHSRSNEVKKDERRRMFYSILDNGSVQMKARFDHFADLSFLGLVDCTKFHDMSADLCDFSSGCHVCVCVWGGRGAVRELLPT